MTGMIPATSQSSTELATETSSSETPKRNYGGSGSPETLDLSVGFDLVHKGRDNKRLKAMRMLVTGRLCVNWVDSFQIKAQCKGDSGELYRLGFTNGRWYCSCKARTDCSHLQALWAIVVVNT